MKTITRSDIPPKYLFCLDMYGVTDNYLEEVNLQVSFERRKAAFARNFKSFIARSFWWDKQYTKDGYFFWYEIAIQDMKIQKP